MLFPFACDIPGAVSGSTCDCGRYRKVVGQMDLNVNKLKNAVKFLRNGTAAVTDARSSHV